MFDSLRARLLAWYTIMLSVVIAASGATMCYLAWHGRLAEIDGRLLARAGALAAALEPAGAGTFDLTLPDLPAPGDGPAGPYHVIWAVGGDVIDRSDADATVPMPVSPGTRSRDGQREVAIRAPAGATVLAGQALAAVRAEIWSLALRLAALGVGALVLSFAGGWWLIDRAFRPIDRIGATARTMVEGDFGARIPVERVETELTQVARALNEAFDRLHGSLERQRRFTADASHELRTPLTTVSTEVQWALARERPPAEYRRALEACRRAVGRMQAIVERLLALARAEAGADDDRRVPLALDDLVRRVADELRPLADTRGIALDVEASPTAVSAVPDRLLDAVTNVVANAIAYNVEGGRVRITLHTHARLAEVAVTDTGIGIAPADVPRIFDPFFQVDPASNRGAGLGLAVTRAIVERHGGDIACESRPGTGTTMTIRLPVAGADASTPRSA
jgi:signal transduction histidine kinase